MQPKLDQSKNIFIVFAFALFFGEPQENIHC